MKNTVVKNYVRRIRGENSRFDDQQALDIPKCMVLSITKEKAIEIMQLMQFCMKNHIAELSQIQCTEKSISPIFYVEEIEHSSDVESLTGQLETSPVGAYLLHVNCSGAWVTAKTNSNRLHKKYREDLSQETIISEPIEFSDLNEDFGIFFE